MACSNRPRNTASRPLSSGMRPREELHSMPLHATSCHDTGDAGQVKNIPGPRWGARGRISWGSGESVSLSGRPGASANDECRLSLPGGAKASLEGAGNFELVPERVSAALEDAGDDRFSLSRGIHEQASRE